MLHSRYIGNAGYEVGLWAVDFRKGEMKPGFFRDNLEELDRSRPRVTSEASRR